MPRASWPGPNHRGPAILLAVVGVTGLLVYHTLNVRQERRLRRLREASAAALAYLPRAPAHAAPPAGEPTAEATPLAVVGERMQRVGQPAPFDAAALALAYQRSGNHDAALRWFQTAERSVRSDPLERFGDSALLSCAAGELGDEAKRQALLKAASGASELPPERASAVYRRAARECLELELAAFTPPLLDAAFGAASRQDDLPARRAHAELAVLALRVGDKVRARALIKPLLVGKDDAYTMSLLLHAQAALGDTAQVRKRLPAALKAVQADADGSSSLARQQLAIVSASLGELERARTLATDWPAALAEAGRWDELLPLRSQPGLTVWHELAIHLREAGRFDLALEATDYGRRQSLRQLAASYKILQAQRRAVPAEQAP